MVEAGLYGEGSAVLIGVPLEILKIAQNIISFSHIGNPISAGYQCIVTPLHSINCFLAMSMSVWRAKVWVLLLAGREWSTFLTQSLSLGAQILSLVCFFISQLLHGRKSIAAANLHYLWLWCSCINLLISSSFGLRSNIVCHPQGKQDL